jgi:exodeoxyribonuclease III
MLLPMKVVTLNANGLRAAASKGLVTWLQALDPDIVCLQEVRASPDKIPLELLGLGLAQFFFPAERPGYSGVAIWSKQKPQEVITGIGNPEFDSEGRVIEAIWPTLQVISAYIPSGTSGPERQAAKMRFLVLFEQHIAKRLQPGRSLIVCGDFNIAHQAIDLKNWKQNQQTSGFLPEEREWLSRFLALGLHDSQRELLGPAVAAYTWWSQRGKAWYNDVGWRLDYQFVTPNLMEKAQNVTVVREPRLSDHAAVVVEYLN